MKRYIRSSYERPYLYIFKHGIGPGTIPKDVSVVKTKDLPNYYTAVWLDRFLTTSELKQYDIPSETRISELLDRIGYCQKNGDVVPCEDVEACNDIKASTQTYPSVPEGWDIIHEGDDDDGNWTTIAKELYNNSGYIWLDMYYDDSDRRYYELQIGYRNSNGQIGEIVPLISKQFYRLGDAVKYAEKKYDAYKDVDACKDITASNVSDDFEIGDIVEIYTSMDGWFGEYEVIREAEPEDYARLSQHYMKDYPGTKYLLRSTKPSFVGETIQTPQTMRKIHNVRACDNIMASAHILGDVNMKRTFRKYPQGYVKASNTLFVDDSILEYAELQLREHSSTSGQSVSSIKEVTDSLYELTVTVDHSGDYYTLHIGISTDDLMNAYNNPFEYISFSPEYVTVFDAKSISQIPYDRDALINLYDSSKYDYQIRFLM